MDVLSLDRPGWRVLVAAAALAILGARAGGAPAAPGSRCRQEAQDCRRTLCSALRDELRRACEKLCRSGSCGRPAVARTLAYVVTRCRQRPDGTITIAQALMVQVGDAPAIPVAAIPEAGPFDAPPGTTRCLFGGTRDGLASPVVGVFQRLGVSPDGETVVFEAVTRGGRLPIPLPEEAQGFFAVRMDGQGLRRLAPPSRDPPFRIRGLFGVGSLERRLAFSADGRRVVYSDLGPGPDGRDVPQAFVLDVRGGAPPRQVTRIPGFADDVRGNPETVTNPFFIDGHTIGFATTADAYGQNADGKLVGVRVDVDGRRPRVFREFIAVPGGMAIPIFAIAGRRPIAALIPLEGGVAPVNPEVEPRFPTSEVFLFDGEHVLQLTDFRRVDTVTPVLRTGGDRIFFGASADPFGLNPLNACQIFSIDMTGAGLRQLTRFPATAHPERGCYPQPPPGCQIFLLGQDPRTRSVVFYSSCDPLGTDRAGADLFAMRADGAGLVQLTRTAGETTETDGTIVVELPGPVAYAAPGGP